jgi:hypothetical protein
LLLLYLFRDHRSRSLSHKIQLFALKLTKLIFLSDINMFIAHNMSFL